MILTKKFEYEFVISVKPWAERLKALFEVVSFLFEVVSFLFEVVYFFYQVVLNLSLGCCDLLPLKKNLVWAKLRDYAICRANPIPILMFFV